MSQGSRRGEYSGHKQYSRMRILLEMFCEPLAPAYVERSREGFHRVLQQKTTASLRRLSTSVGFSPGSPAFMSGTK